MRGFYGLQEGIKPSNLMPQFATSEQIFLKPRHKASHSRKAILVSFRVWDTYVVLNMPEPKL